MFYNFKTIGHIFFALFSSFQYLPLTVTKIADGWIWTIDLGCRKWPLNQVCHNHCLFATIAPGRGSIFEKSSS